jgi:hypothetical protein
LWIAAAPYANLGIKKEVIRMGLQKSGTCSA